MRDAAYILIYCQKKDEEIRKFNDCLRPEKYNLAMEVVQHLSGFDYSTGKVSIVGMPPRLKYVLQESSKILVDDARLSSEMPRALKEAIKSEIGDFLQLLTHTYLKRHCHKCRKN